MSTPEAQVLKPADPSIADSDDWEIFILNDAHVVHESTGQPSSLLAAYADKPMQVEGRLESVERAQNKCLIRKPLRPTTLVIENVIRFSYGETTDGEYLIWAEGKAGWFEIHPSKAYQPIYKDMVQAIGLLYFIADMYSEACSSETRKKGGGPRPQLLFQAYAEEPRFECGDAEQAEEIFHKHRNFLIMCFLTRAQGVVWERTPIYAHYKQHFSDIFETCLERMGTRLPQAQTKAKAKAKSKSKSPTPANPNAHPPLAKTKKKDDAPKKDNNWWEAAALFEFIQKAVNQGVLKPGQQHITLERVARLVMRTYEIDPPSTSARDVLVVHAPNLVYMMARPKKHGPRSDRASTFTSEPIFAELSNPPPLSAAAHRRAEAVELHHRQRTAKLDAPSSCTDESSSDSTPALSAPRRRRKVDPRHKFGTLSILRPKSSQYSGKSNGLKRRGPSSEESSSDSNSDSDLDSDDNNNESANSTTPRKTKRHQRIHPSHHSPSPSTSTSPSLPTHTLPYPLPYIPTDTTTTPSTTATLTSTRLPTYAPNGPCDSWICSVDGCGQRIFGASKEIGLRLVEEHVADHSAGREKAVGVAWGEAERCKLPVEHLLRRIRGGGVGPFGGVLGVGEEVDDGEGEWV